MGPRHFTHEPPNCVIESTSQNFPEFLKQQLLKYFYDHKLRWGECSLSQSHSKCKGKNINQLWPKPDGAKCRHCKTRGPSSLPVSPGRAVRPKQKFWVRCQPRHFNGAARLSFVVRCHWKNSGCLIFHPRYGGKKLTRRPGQDRPRGSGLRCPHVLLHLLFVQASGSCVHNAMSSWWNIQLPKGRKWLYTGGPREPSRTKVKCSQNKSRWKETHRGKDLRCEWVGKGRQEAL